MPGRSLRQRLADLERFVADVIFDRRDDPPAALLGGVLRLLSHAYGAVVRLRVWLYRHRILHDRPLGCLVVAVGNLTVGGTGKTPVVEKFARALAERGRRVAILSRGYKSRAEPAWRRAWRALIHAEEPPPRVVGDGQGGPPLLGSELAGDEPYMLARNLPNVVVLVDKNRVKAGAYAIRRFGCDTLLLDDGFQYLALKGALNLLLIDKSNPFGNECLLPRGILREPIHQIRRASYIFLTKSDGRPDPELQAVIRQHHPSADLIECAHRPRDLRAVGRAGDRPLAELAGRRIAVFSGIATPESFEAMLGREGAVLVHVRRFLDHHRFDEDDLAGIYEGAERAGAEWVVTTEKDAVRLRPDWEPPRPTYYLRLEIGILTGSRDFDEAVDRVCFGRRIPGETVPASAPAP